MKRSQHAAGRSPARRIHLPRTVIGLAAAAMVAPFVTTVAPQVSAAPGDEVVQILSFNDYHGHVEDDTAGTIDGSFGGEDAGGGEYLSTKLDRTPRCVDGQRLVHRRSRRPHRRFAVLLRSVPRRAIGRVVERDGARLLRRRQPRIRRRHRRTPAHAERRVPPGRRVLLPGRCRTPAPTSSGWPPT